MATQLENNLNEIKRQKDTYIIPTNIRDGVKVFGVTGNLKPNKPAISGPMTNERAIYIFDYMLTTNYSSYKYFSMNWAGNDSIDADSWGTYNKIDLKTTYGIYKTENISRFTQLFNESDNSINSGLGVEHYVFIPFFDGTTYMTIACIPNNNGTENADLPYIKLSFSHYSTKSFALKTEHSETTTNYKAFFIDIASDEVKMKTYYMTFPYYFICATKDVDAFYSRSPLNTVYYSPLNIVCLSQQTFYSRQGELNTKDTNVTTWQPYQLRTFYEGS